MNNADIPPKPLEYIQSHEVEEGHKNSEDKYSESIQSLNPMSNPRDIDDFPEGGARAWLAVIGGFAILFNTWGVTTTFGVFQAYYKSDFLSSYSQSTLGWIQSVQIAFIFWGGTLTGRLFDLGYFEYLLAFGSIWTFFCYMMMAESTQYYQLLLSQGVGMGLGMGCCFGPSMACVSTYFKKRRGLAIGLCSSGAGIGGVILPIVSNNLFPTLGFKWTTRILAFIHLGVTCMAISMLRPRFNPRKMKKCQEERRILREGEPSAELQMSAMDSFKLFFVRDSWIDPTAFHDSAYVLTVGGIVLSFFTLYIPFYYLQQFAVSIGVSKSVTKYVVTFLAAGSAVGRILPTYLADTYGPLNVLIISVFFASILNFCWNAVHNTAGVIVFALIYGFVSGAIGSFPPFILPHLSPDIRKIGVRLGMAFICMGSISLIANP
ncbi:MFS general substrate transporter, partial [Nadsonia fulvescens var. elongata DSM 6958]